jgi:hypothetical protein
MIEEKKRNLKRAASTRVQGNTHTHSTHTHTHTHARARARDRQRRTCRSSTSTVSRRSCSSRCCRAPTHGATHVRRHAPYRGLDEVRQPPQLRHDTKRVCVRLACTAVAALPKKNLALARHGSQQLVNASLGGLGVCRGRRRCRRLCSTRRLSLRASRRLRVCCCGSGRHGAQCVPNWAALLEETACKLCLGEALNDPCGCSVQLGSIGRDVEKRVVAKELGGAMRCAGDAMREA